jgi:hypothetical protein
MRLENLMLKLVSIVCAFFIIVVVAGCGKGSTAAAVILPASVPLTSADVSGKTFYSTSINGYAVYQIKADTGQTAAWNSSASNPVSPTDIIGTWGFSITGGLVLTRSDASVAHQFTCIQKETSYFLMSDENHNITRFYFDTISATALASAEAYIPLSPLPLRVKLGGSIQGTPLVSTFSNISTLAGNTAPLPTGYTYTDASNGIGVNASFNQPTGITTDGINIYVADNKNNIIRKIVIADGTVTRLAGSSIGTAGYVNSTDGTGNTATFNLPAAVTTDGIFLYVADTGNHSIRKVDTNSGSVTLIAGSTIGAAGSIDALNGTDARFNQPTGITTDGTNLYVADSGNDTIRKIVISSGAVVTLAGAATTAGSSDSTDGTGATARFNQPARIATDGSNLYVTDFRNGTVRKVSIATGAVTTIAGVAGSLGSADGVGTAATFNQPNGITTDGTNLFITDSNLNTIRKIIIFSGSVSTLPGSFITPVGITTDGISLFVSETYILHTDSNNNPTYTYGNTIRKIH